MKVGRLKFQLLCYSGLYVGLRREFLLSIFIGNETF